MPSSLRQTVRWRTFYFYRNLEYLANNSNNNIFQKDIEKQFNIGKSSVAGTLKVTEEMGVIVRQSVEGDARLKRVCLADSF